MQGPGEDFGLGKPKRRSHSSKPCFTLWEWSWFTRGPIDNHSLTQLIWFFGMSSSNPLTMWVDSILWSKMYIGPGIGRWQSLNGMAGTCWHAFRTIIAPPAYELTDILTYIEDICIFGISERGIDYSAQQAPAVWSNDLSKTGDHWRGYGYGFLAFGSPAAVTVHCRD